MIGNVMIQKEKKHRLLDNSNRTQPDFDCPATGPVWLGRKIEMYKFRKFYIPDRMMDGIIRYIDDRKPPGDFLTAVICNDLKEAVARADDENLKNLPAFTGYFYNEAPAACQGSKKKMQAWLKERT